MNRTRPWLPGLFLLLACIIGCSSTKDADHRMPPVPSPAPTRVQLPETPRLDDYLAYTAENNAGLRAARSRWEAARQTARQAGALPDPRLSFSEYIESVETRVGPQRWAASLSQTFPWFGKRSLRARAARSGAEMARADYEAIRQKVLYDVTHAYTEYYYLAHAIDVTQQNVQFLNELEEIALTKLAGGETSHAAVIRTQVERAKLDDRLRELEAMRTPTVARLNALLDRSSNAELPWPSELPDPEPPAEPAVLRQQLVDENPELRALDAAVLKATTAVSLARREQYPDLTLGITYIATDEARMPDVADSGKDPVIAMLTINVPLWGAKNDAVRHEARAQLEAMMAARQSKENELQARLASAVYGFEDAGRKIVLCRDTLIPQAKQSVEVIQQSFAAGKAEYLDLIDAQRTLLEVELLYERAHANRLQRRAEIILLTGGDFPPTRSSQDPGNPEDPNTVQ